MENRIAIKDIYAGKPDAKDEINTGGLSDFVKSYVLPYNFDITKLIEGNYYYISGYKGTGKTALLFYLDDYVKKVDSSTCSSFVFFKEEFTDAKKQELEALSRRLLSSITIGQDVLLDGTDFEYIWRWLLFKRIIEDNKDYYNNGLFVDDDNWCAFEKIMKRIINPTDKKKFIIPPKIKVAIPYVDPSTMIPVSTEIELDFQSDKTPDAYNHFVRIIDDAEDAFRKISRTDIPYYIFIDELEAYFGDEEIFKRDLRLIRDLIFTVKRLNILFSTLGKNTKIICAVRTEIINAVNRFVVPKELNKVTSGFEVPLIWDYSNTNSFAHPIIKILLKRIELAENSRGVYAKSDKEIYQRWFPERIYKSEPVNYILNNGWNKPRDIVRLIMASQNCIHNNSTTFSQAVFDTCQKRYSIDSLTEIKEEMRALYSPEQINDIISCLTGFKTVFSISELETRIARYYRNSVLTEKLMQVLGDLYRLGIIGNYSLASKSFRWQHKGDDGLIMSDEWNIMIHSALQSALSISSRHDRGVELYRRNSPQRDEIVDVTVYRMVPNYLLVEFIYGDTICRGSIHISQLSYEYVTTVDAFASIGDKFKAKIITYNEDHKSWAMTLKA